MSIFLQLVKNLLNKMEVEKEYNLIAGHHSAIVRKTESGIFEYLELQAEDRYGWLPLENSHIKSLFGLKEKIDKSKMLYVPSILFDVESLMKNDDFLDLLKFINFS